MANPSQDKGGRPRNYSGDLQNIVNVFVKHLGPILRSKTKRNAQDSNIFPDAEKAKMKPELVHPFRHFFKALAVFKNRRAFANQGFASMEQNQQPSLETCEPAVGSW